MPDQPERNDLLPSSASQEPGQAATLERRSGLRHPFVMNAEAEAVTHGVRLPVRISDLSEYGCYLDTLNPFSSGTRIRIYLKKESESFELVGMVVYSHEGMGMGVAFTDVNPDAQGTIQKWLSEKEDVRPIQVSSNSELDQVLGASDRHNAGQIERLVRFLVKKGVLTQEEARNLLS